jgi:hypothetical protein
MWVLFIGDLHKPNDIDECAITLASSSASGSDWCISLVWWVGSEPLTYSSLCRQRTICSIWGVSALFLWKTRHKINTLKAKLFRTIEGEGGTFVILWGTSVIKNMYIFSCKFYFEKSAWNYFSLTIKFTEAFLAGNLFKRP